MSRQLPKAIANLEGRRRSPRISALEAWQAQGSRRVGERESDPVVQVHHSSEAKKTSTASCNHILKLHLDSNSQGQGQGPAFRTRARKKRKLKPVQERETQSDGEHIQKKNDQPSNLPSATFIPEKRILELVLDILQRRDTYEIFAEPVDPNEVEDYYDIIEEPMDFGTMRAKLHEGMYKSLEQFEHDVFLIFNNAMHFNSSRTIYFRQARAINELAKKVFDILKTNPENFDLEFSETRRRVGRRNRGDSSSPINKKSSDLTVGMSSQILPCSSRRTSNRKCIKANPGRSDISTHVDAIARDFEIPTCTKDRRRYRSFEVDKRCAYRHSLSPFEDESMFSTIYSKLKLLEHVNQQDIGYRESLMLFVKDLGPTAQNIAKRKLLGCEIHTASTSQWRPNASNAVTALRSQNPLDQYTGHPNVVISPKDRVLAIACRGDTDDTDDKLDHAKVEGILNADREKSRSPLEGKTQGSQGMSIGGDRVRQNQNQKFGSDSYYPGARAENLSCSIDGSKETGKKSTSLSLDKSKLIDREELLELATEDSQTNELELKSEERCKFQSQFWPFQTRDASSFLQDRSRMQKPSLELKRGDWENIAAQCPTYEVSCSSEAVKIFKSDQTLPLASNSTFSLPYLKTRLHQINSLEHYRFSQQEPDGRERPFTVQDHPSDLSTVLYTHNQ